MDGWCLGSDELDVASQTHSPVCKSVPDAPRTCTRPSNNLTHTRNKNIIYRTAQCTRRMLTALLSPLGSSQGCSLKGQGAGKPTLVVPLLDPRLLKGPQQPQAPALPQLQQDSKPEPPP